VEIAARITRIAAVGTYVQWVSAACATTMDIATSLHAAWSRSVDLRHLPAPAKCVTSAAMIWTVRGQILTTIASSDRPRRTISEDGVVNADMTTIVPMASIVLISTCASCPEIKCCWHAGFPVPDGLIRGLGGHYTQEEGTVPFNMGTPRSGLTVLKWNTAWSRRALTGSRER